MNLALDTLVTLAAIDAFIFVKGPIKDLIQKIVLQLIQTFVQELRKDALFAEIYYGVEICGSWRDNIKINEPDEIDVNLVFDLCEAVIRKIAPGYVIVNISAYKNLRLIPFANSDGLLLVNKFQSWFESRLSGLNINSRLHSVLGHSVRISLRKNGPAHMLSMEIKECPSESLLEPGFKFSVDLTPGIRGTKENWVSDTHPTGVKVNDYEWVAIPKPPKGATNEYSLFVLSYPRQENQIINGKYTVKFAMRLIKKIAQRKSIGNLISYHIKTAFLWANKEDAKFWNNSADKVVEKMLEQIIEHLKKRELRNYWDPECNELDKFSEDQIDTMRMQLQAALNEYRKSRNTVKLFDLFVTTDEKEQLLTLTKNNYWEVT